MTQDEQKQNAANAMTAIIMSGIPCYSITVYQTEMTIFGSGECMTSYARILQPFAPIVDAYITDKGEVAAHFRFKFDAPEAEAAPDETATANADCICDENGKCALHEAYPDAVI